MFPRMYALSKKLLTVPASTGSVERLFSQLAIHTKSHKTNSKPELTRIRVLSSFNRDWLWLISVFVCFYNRYRIMNFVCNSGQAGLCTIECHLVLYSAISENFESAIQCAMGHVKNGAIGRPMAPYGIWRPNTAQYPTVKFWKLIQVRFYGGIKCACWQRDVRSIAIGCGGTVRAGWITKE